MVEVRVMSVGVFHLLMLMGMRMRLFRRIIRAVSMLMMLVVKMEVVVFHKLMRMFVGMLFRDVQPHA